MTDAVQDGPKWFHGGLEEKPPEEPVAQQEVAEEALTPCEESSRYLPPQPHRPQWGEELDD